MSDRRTVDTITSDELDDLYDQRAVYRAAWHSARGRAAHQRCINADLRTELAAKTIRADQAEAERDGAYRERAHLVALLAAMTDRAVITYAPDIEEPGWQVVYLTIGGQQCSWHIAPRDAELFEHVERVGALDVRALWDGHTTEEKYAHIAAHTAELAQRCGPACSEQHTETGRCEIARNR